MRCPRKTKRTMLSEIHQCADCLEQFCAVCELEAERCPDCREWLCGECAGLALQERQCRCAVCADPELADLSFPYEGSRTLYKQDTNLQRGRLSE